jgi:hypothetical protein
LLVDLAEAQQQAGNPDHPETLREAARISHETDDDALLLRVVTSASPVWSTLPGMTTEETRALLARARKIPCDDATRSRILARHATEQYLDDPAEGDALAREALALARKSGDEAARLEALYRHTGMLITPLALDERRREIDEALPLASAAQDILAQAYLTGSAVVGAIQAGDLPVALTRIAEADELLHRCNLAPLRWSSRCRQVWRAGLAGDLDEAEQLIRDTREFGEANGIGQAAPASLIQCSMLRWQQDRTITALRYTDADTSLVSVLPGNRHFLARALAAEPSTRLTARAIMGELAEHGFDDLPTDLFWSSILVATAETAYLLELPDAACAIHRLLEPYVEQVAFSGLFVAAPIAHGLGVAAATYRHPESAAYFRQSVKLAEQLEAPVLLARTLRFATLALDTRDVLPSRVARESA